jgi:ankyrin repeat protein
LHSIIDELERRGVSVTERDATGQTALHYAARGGHILMVKRLLRRSFGSSLDVDAEGNAADALSFNPPLSYDTRTPQGVTALMIAVWNNHTEIIKLLLQKNPKIKLYNRLKYLDLERRPARPATRRIEATAEILIADRDEFQGQNLLYAVLSDDAYAVGALINQDAIVNMIGRFNEVSPLHGAALIGSLDIVNLLVDAGAELDISCAAVPNPTDWSFLSAKESLHAVHENLKLRQTLEAEMNVPIVTGLTPLRIAAEKGYRRIVERLLAAGADVNTPVTRPGLTALEAAAAKGHSEIVKILLDAGAHVELMLEDGTLMSNLESIMSGGRLVLASAALNDCQAPLVISSNLKRRDPALVYRLLKTKKVEPIGLFKESIEARHRLAIEETEARLQRLFVMYEKGRFFRMPSDE